jgi:hypothetical protein
MNNTQIRAMRELHADISSVVKRTVSAKEMALQSHNLSRDVNMATLANGDVFVWDARFDHWAMWKKG